jgi:FixJ family two-component response regulator
MTTTACIVRVVDDDASWRKSAQRLLSAAGYEVALYESAEAFLGTADLAAPGCVLLDLSMPGLTGLQLQQRLAESGHRLPVIFISGHGDIRSSVLAMKSGAEDFLTKPVDTDGLLHAIDQAVARNREDRERSGAIDGMRGRINSLTPAERKVFDLVVHGKLNKHIAVELGSAERTIKWHRQHIMQKLQVESLAELVSVAERLGLVDPRNRPPREVE